MRHFRAVGLAFTMQVAACCLAQAASAADGPVSARDSVLADHRLPKDTLAYLTIRSVPDLKGQWQKTLWGQLGKEEALADFWKDLEAQMTDLSAKVEDQVGLSLDDLLEIPQGELSFAVVQPGGEKELSVVALMDFGTKEDSVRKMLEKVAAALEKKGAKRSEEEFEETRLTIYQGKKAEKPDDDEEDEKDDAKTETPTTTVYCTKDTFLVIGSNAEAVKSIISQWDGKNASTLAENDFYRHIAERCSDESQDSKPLVTWYVDPIGLIKSVVGASDTVSNQLTLVMGFLPVLGLDKLHGIGGTIDLANGGYDTISRTMIYVEPPPVGIVNMFQFPPIGQSPPKWVSSQVDSYFGANWNIEKAYAATEALFDAVQGPGFFAKMIEDIAKASQAGGLHLKKDLIDHLTGKLHLVGYAPDEETDLTERFVFAAELKNPAGLKTTLAKIAKLPGFSGKTREFQGEVVYEVPVGAKAADDDDEEAEEGDEGAMQKPSALGVSVSGSQLMIASDVQLLEQVMRGIGDEETLADSPAYKKIAAKFPTKTSWISFQKEDAQIKAAYELFRSGKFEHAMNSVFSAAFTKLPPFDAIKKYLTPSGTYMQPEDRGMLVISFKLQSDKDEK